MDKFKLKSQFNGSTLKVRYHLNHIWANAPINECKFCVIEANWLDFHKLTYIVFKLLNTLPTYNKKPLTSPFLWSLMYVITYAYEYPTFSKWIMVWTSISNDVWSFNAQGPYCTLNAKATLWPELLLFY